MSHTETGKKNQKAPKTKALFFITDMTTTETSPFVVFGAEVEGLRILFGNLSSGSGSNTPPTSPLKGGGFVPSPSSSTVSGNVILELARVIGTVLVGSPIAVDSVSATDSISFDVFLAIVDDIRRSVATSLAAKSAAASMSPSSPTRGQYGAMSRSELGGPHPRQKQKGKLDEQMLRLKVDSQRLEIVERDQVIEELQKTAIEQQRSTQELGSALEASAAEVRRLKDRISELEEANKELRATARRISAEAPGRGLSIGSSPTKRQRAGECIPSCAARKEFLEKQVRDLTEQLRSHVERESIEHELREAAASVVKTVLSSDPSPDRSKKIPAGTMAASTQTETTASSPGKQQQEQKPCEQCKRSKARTWKLRQINLQLRTRLERESHRIEALYNIHATSSTSRLDLSLP